MGCTVAFRGRRGAYGTGCRGGECGVLQGDRLGFFEVRVNRCCLPVGIRQRASLPCNAAFMASRCSGLQTPHPLTWA